MAHTEAVSLGVFTHWWSGWLLGRKRESAFLTWDDEPC